PLEKAVARLAGSARGYSTALRQAVGADRALPEGAQPALDRILMLAEHALTRPEGLPGRPWYRHQVYAPVTSTGRMKAVRGVCEAIEQRRWAEATQQIGVAAGAIEAFAREVDRAAGLLAPGG